MQVARITVLSALVASTIVACKSPNNKGHEYSYAPMSQFRLDSHAIAPNTPMRILAYSGGTPGLEKAIHYHQFIVVKTTGDTVRILTPLLLVPGESEKGTYVTPELFDGAKGVFDAVYRTRDSSQMMMMMNIVAAASQDTVQFEERVIMNKTLHIFESGNYKTTIGILQFSKQPW